jgi:ribose transport system permease protein
MTVPQTSTASSSSSPATPKTSGPARGEADREALRRRLITTLPLTVLVVLVLAVTARQPSFLGISSVRAVLDGSAPILLLALGETMVILIGGIDLSVAALASLGTVLLAMWLPGMGPLAAVAMLAVLTLAGAINGLAAAYLQVPSFIVTLGAMGLWSGIALTVSGASTISITKGYDAIGWIRDLRLAQLPASFVLSALIAVACAVVIRAFARGRLLHAMGLAERAVLMSGTRTARVRVAAFALSGLFSGLAAIMLAATQYSGSPTLANSLQLPTIAAVVVGGSAITGGVGGPLRTLVGALIIAVLRVGLSVIGVDPSYEQIFYGAVVIAAVALTLDRSRIGVVK